ncbi:PLDc N-terminal domain-containing protein [Mangrovibacterium lignilyticum]|uniref:PLDc N-terminal domain-containing protein n=1 Tax=Mangrovibacterium lignilyticum TaxID=2668052 RepID=UPI0013CFBFD1|nr:PLDc N-terminal domain-containing protein [Mangrovibacterium lignilyticum]
MNSFLVATGPQYILTLQFLFAILILLPAMALVSVFRNEFEGNKRYFWAALILFFPIIGSLLYIFIGRQHRLRRALWNENI